ncbi:uncharacterized protein LOC125225346 isoform X1 [Leguminivora glycinivorella]|uniref:uncharacterized protein LOC125225043 isoform X1 n=2 Tax=Leguminivora glycinivorella TaxID=1035111 RepID=UPI00200F5423|nr:uncharacterized protein LOC125225043 isoform X1 [Leguminivora glycinivorella]XP_047984501.1 uncharacterized protein LOC125225043 isoform X1 [Leguminivora glycinivorella]XP_047984502.1 uncharacterized protein LOC125225043 isoform X1 [Leguminivora glycinivorella]XP_047984504.1 uncharacterized protein LOC125225043 isoform X1 [Leguminivora glycinivorella]XP_047984970.1 uncharacterized protein LOC125225346 isoform X1 [Leguminivora glycinivorella]XP_047984971.1 uncharacterized protein LOC12522534
MPFKFSKGSQNKETVLTISERGITTLQTAVVYANPLGDKNNVLCKYRLILDPGSQRSYVTFQAAKELKLPVEEESLLTIFTFGEDPPKEIHSPIVILQLVTRTNKKIVIQANCVQRISRGFIPNVKLRGVPESYVLADDGSVSGQVQILIGNDYYFNIIYETKIQLDSNLFLVDSALGWIVSGKTEPQLEEESYVVTYAQTCIETKLHQPDSPLCDGDIKNLWELECIGICDSPKATREEEAIKNFNETTVKINNRYTVSWPWITYPPDLPNNFGIAFGRLSSLLKRMDQETLMSYDDTFKQQLAKGIIEVVPTSGTSTGNAIHYLPFHGVRHRGKPMRIVYDASSKSNKNTKSLNECLYRGPLMLEDLTGLLIKFRTHHIGLTSDIEKAFLQMALHEKDRDVTRFLWLKDTSKPVSQDNLLYLRFCRVPFGVISSPFLLNATIKEHLNNAEDQHVRQKANDIYVDNFVSGCSTTAEAIELYKSLKGSFQDISMSLRDWSSNSEEFMKMVPDTCKENKIKVLGLEWDIKKDTLQLKPNLQEEAVTKRGILKTIASIYDPCGYAAPHTLSAKLFLQGLWKAGVSWDSPLSSELTEEWNIIRQNLEVIGKVSVDRCYMKTPTEANYQLHCFTDASLQAYAASVFLVCGSKKSFIMGKSRLIPTKDQDNLKIPRLELLGVLIGCRLMKFVLKFLQQKIVRQVLWTDSQIVIEWCKSNKLLPPFVARRVEEIKTNKDLEIRYLPSSLNPADVGTRPLRAEEDKEKWLNGPQFITEDPQKWPTTSGSEPTSSLLTGEGLGFQEDIEMVDKEDPVVNVNPMKTEEIITPNEVIGNNQSTDDKLHKLKEIQAKYFPLEVEGKETNLSRNLGVFKDIDDLLRCKGRMKNANWSFDKRYPILIPKESDFTKEIIMKTHQENKHVGVSHTLDKIREMYWIPQGRSKVQRILKGCPECMKHDGGPYRLPETPALPKERVNYSSPFTYVGTDYLGPLLVNNGNGSCKRWISLYTCLAVRAIHLEVVKDLTAEEGLLALKRMISARGVPTLITSDNAAHYKLLSEILQDPYCIEKEIKWKFIPQLAPWHGGFYERLIGLTKNCMKKTLQKHLLNDSQLATTVKEIEAVLNTRPLTYVDSEPDHVLKPSDFLTMGKCIVMETSSMDPITSHGTVTKDNLIKGWKKALIILREFKEMFENRYLLNLRERYSHHPKEPRVTSKLTPKIGQIVQIKGDTKNRINWKVGKIVSLKEGADGLCRVATVQVGDTIYTRSIAHLYPLEIEDGEEQCKQTSHEESVEESVQVPDVPHPTRRDDVMKESTNDVLKTSEQKSYQLTELNESEEIPSDSVLLEPASSQLHEPEPKSIPEPDPLAVKDMTFCENTDPETHHLENIASAEHHDESRPKRAAALRALEKIKEWTSNLVAVLLPVVGSVATNAKL